MLMKAAILYKTGEKLVIENNIEIPELKRGQILVKIAYSGICHSQINEIRGDRGEDKYLPHMLGHEATGIVEKTGPDVSKIIPGDKVVLGWIKGQGIDAGGTTYKLGNKNINAGPVTTFSDYSIVSENRCIKLPDCVPMKEGVLLGCAIPTGAGIVINELKPEKDKTIVIYGMGGIGLSSLIATKLYDFKKTIVVDVEERKLELAKSIGADVTINSRDNDPVDMIRQLTDNIGVDYSIDAAGFVTTIEQAFKSVKNNGGLCVFASHPKEGEKIQLDPYDLICGKQIKGSWGGGCNPDKDIPEFAKLYKKGHLPFKKLLSRSYFLKDINSAIEDIYSRKIERAVVEIDKNI